MMKRIGCGLLVFAAIVAAFYVFRMYSLWTEPNTAFDESSKSLYIFPDESLDEVVGRMMMDSIISSETEFQNIAELMSFETESLHTGHYLIKKGTSYRSLINLLKSGNETPIRLTYTNIRMLSDFTELLGEKLLPSTEEFNAAIQTVGAERNLNEYNLLTMFLPDTYEVYWSKDAESLIMRLASETDKFWDSNNRKDKAAQESLTNQQVYTLASVVQKESNDPQEQPIIASLYLNRLHIGMPLQADPTVIYAIGDFSIRRVLKKQLEIDSPYNTYKYKGLPAGPICMPMKATIDAVLDHADTDYLYMCLKPSESGGHVFSSSDKEHIRNANRYHKWLDSRGIKK